jgi:hypothetical protein
MTDELRPIQVLSIPVSRVPATDEHIWAAFYSRHVEGRVKRGRGGLGLLDFGVDRRENSAVALAGRIAGSAILFLAHFCDW